MKNKIVKVIGAAMIGALLLTGCSVDVNINDNTLGSDIDDEDEADSDSDKENNSSDKEDKDSEDDKQNETPENNGADTADIEIVEGGELGEYADLNAQYFLKIGDRVYFRAYGEDSFQNPCLWGNYMAYANAGTSAIYYYDEVSGETVKAFTDYGYGKIVFDNGVFYMNTKKNNGETSYIYAKNPDGSDVEMPKQYEGEIVDYQYDSIIIENHDVGSSTIVAYNPSKKEEEISLRSSGYIRYMGCFQGTVYYYESTGSYDEITLYSHNFGDANSVNLGKVTRRQGSDAAGYEVQFMNPEWIDFALDGTAYWGIGYRSGTGNFFDSAVIVKTFPDAANSATVDNSVNGTAYQEMPYICINESGSYSIVANEPYAYVTVQNTNSNYDLFHQDWMGEREFIVGDFTSAYSNSAEFTELVLAEAAEYTGNEIYAMRVYQVYDSDADIGWRMGYRANKIEYVRIDRRSGKAEVILTCNHNKNYSGY